MTTKDELGALEGSEEKTDPLDELWADDRLGRRVEAEMLEEVLVMEAGECSRPGREHAFVLALDAAYGEGKTFFLNKLRQHLATKHPVAFVDAWVDDANDEPLLAIMSAINEALEPFLSKTGKAKHWLKGATTAALPIISKVAVGAGTTFLKKYIGNSTADEVAALAKGTATPSPTLEEEVISAAVDNASTEITSLADKMGAEMLANYKARRKSKETFKHNMRCLVSALEAEAKNQKPPLFVVIDELDRCRPDYAIKVLEEVKHLFDIPGVVFIIAIHGDQLEKSIAAVYGADFDAKAYLHRFFSRRYKLRRLTMRELVASRVAVDELDQIDWNYPALMKTATAAADRDLASLIAAFCKDFEVTPREFSTIADGLRIFGRTWKEKVPIELVYLLGLLLRSVRALPLREEIAPAYATALHGGWDQSGALKTSSCHDLWRSYTTLRSISLSDLYSADHRINYETFVVDALEQENTQRFGNRVVRGETSFLARYEDRVSQFGRLLDQTNLPKS